MKHYKYQVRDNLNRIWGQADTVRELEGVCCQGRVLYNLTDGAYVPDSLQPHWMERPNTKKVDGFRWPSAKYRGQWLVTTRDGHTVSSSSDKEKMFAVAQMSRARALWEWADHEYVRYDVPEIDKLVQFDHVFYLRPVKVREEWLVCAASGRIWARGARIDTVLADLLAGNRRALWRLVDGQYELYMVGEKMVQV